MQDSLDIKHTSWEIPARSKTIRQRTVSYDLQQYKTKKRDIERIAKALGIQVTVEIV